MLTTPNRASVVPYLTGGEGGMTMFERQPLTVTISLFPTPGAPWTAW